MTVLAVVASCFVIALGIGFTYEISTCMCCVGTYVFMNRASVLRTGEQRNSAVGNGHKDADKQSAHKPTAEQNSYQMKNADKIHTHRPRAKEWSKCRLLCGLSTNHRAVQIGSWLIDQLITCYCRYSMALVNFIMAVT